MAAGADPPGAATFLCRGAASGTRSAPLRGPARLTSAWGHDGAALALLRPAQELARGAATFAEAIRFRYPIVSTVVGRLPSSG